MNALLEHVWGASPAQDRIWAQVTGMSPDKAVRNIIVAFQAFIDESVTDGGWFVLGGYLANTKTWAAFAKDWEEMLPFAVRGPNGNYRFKMREMAVSPERLERVPAFYRIIEHHNLCSLSCRINVAMVAQARARIMIPNIYVEWDWADNPYKLAFRCLMDMFHTNRPKMAGSFPLSESIDFIFDERSEKKFVLEMWDGYMNSRDPETRKLYGSHPRFESDEKFLPLQAADLWSWWVREWTEAGTPEKIRTRDFGSWKSSKEPMGVDISFNEDQMTNALIAMLRPQLLPGIPILDRKNPSRVW
jgi:hypothetical protein